MSVDPFAPGTWFNPEHIRGETVPDRTELTNLRGSHDDD